MDVRTQALLLSLLRQALWGNGSAEMVEPTPKELVEAIRMAKIQTVMVPVADVVYQHSCLKDLLSAKAQERLQLLVQSNFLIHSQIDAVLVRVVSALRKEGIDPVLLKGQGLAKYYPVPELRQCGDIDLYVGTAHYRRSYEVLKGVMDGMEDASVLEGDGKHYHAHLEGISVEVHQYPEVLSSASFNRIYQHYARKGLSEDLVEIAVGDTRVWTPADSFNAFYIFSHLWNHFLYCGVGLRQVCDWAVFLHARGDKLDKEYLHRVLTELKLMTPWKVFGCLAVDVLGLPEEGFPFYEAKYGKKALKVMEHIWVEGNFGYETEFMRTPDRGYLYEKLFSLKFYLKRFGGMVPLFPYHALQRVNYVILNGFIRLFRDFG